MSYENADNVTYEWAESATFGATSVVHYIQGIRGKVGFVRDLAVDITTSMVGTTSVPEIQVGISSGDTTYGRYRLGTTASAGYGISYWSASDDPFIVGNPPRTASDYAGHIVLDGSPYTSSGTAGGSYSTVLLQGRIPRSGLVVTNVVQGLTSSQWRIYLRDPLDPNIVTGQLVNVLGVQGVTGGPLIAAAITTVSTANNYIEVTGTFGGAYTSGGVVNFVVAVTLKAGVGGTPTGGGIPRVKVQWIGVSVP